MQTNASKEKTSILPFIFKVASPFKFHILGQLIIAVIWAIDLSFRPYLVKVILNRTTYLDPEQAIDSLLPPVALYVFMSALIVTVFRFYDWLFTKFRPALRAHITSHSMSHILNQSHSYYQNNFAGSIANKINDISNGVIEIIHIFVDRFFSNALGLIIAAYTIGQVETKFASALIIWVVLIITVTLSASKKFIETSDAAAEAKSKFTGQIVDVVSNIMSVRLFSGKIFEQTFLKKTMSNFIQAVQRRDILFLKIDFFQGITFVALQALCLWWLILGIKQGNITAGDFALILNINTSIVGALWALTYDIRNCGEAIGNVKQGLRTIMAPIEIPDSYEAKRLKVTKGEINFENIVFHYKNDSPLFDNLSVTIKPKQKVGLVGFSGSGKTTFVNLILRLFNINVGTIFIDGQDIRHVSQDSLRQAISMIPQDSSLFHRSLLENIRYGRLDATDEEVIEAAKKAHAHDFIMDQPEGYDSLVGERGIKLSGGQRQRIAIARAILKNAPILILDEATSALDSITEHKIQESIEDLMQGKTTLIIAHRLSTLLQMDRIIVFDEGRIVEDGSHEELLTREGLYKTLWEAQVGGFLPQKKTNLGLSSQLDTSE
ncbi:MAG: transporter ATP-binding protein [Rickettsiaceae bacterium]|jgi:ATP-binding cassette subfamily B protein|nr:transporter ATP-binding protein [Rickettsiaceae bacterium]